MISAYLVALTRYLSLFLFSLSLFPFSFPLSFSFSFSFCFSFFHLMWFLICSLCEVDWSLPMTAASQHLFFQKVRGKFARATVGIGAAQKKKYRLSPDELTRVRNVSVFFSQVWSFLSARIPEIEATQLRNLFIEGTSEDQDFLHLLDSRPSKFALSMLRSRTEESRKQEAEKQQMIHSEVAQQREAVTQAQWAWFCSALKADQSLLQVVNRVPAQVKAKLHAKVVQRRKEQAESGERATKGYQENVQSMCACSQAHVNIVVFILFTWAKQG